MNYNEAIEYLYSLSSLGWKLGLEKIRELLQELDEPHKKYRVIHVAGTNGKGSTSAIMESILRAAGYRTGLFTSPHLIDVRERIKYNGNNISREEFFSYIVRLKPLIEKYRCTFFEAITAIAFTYFADKEIEVAVIEVGLGGRLDATNVVEPAVTIITDVGHDHTRILGRSREKIAMEKGGIIKEQTPCLTISGKRDVIKTLARICNTRNAPFIQVAKLVHINNVTQNESKSTFDLQVNGTLYPQLKLSLLGEHQIKNATLAIAAANYLDLRITPQAIYDGLLNVHWEGRLQVLRKSPKLVVDAAHNPDGIEKLTNAIKTLFFYNRLHVIIGITKTKNYRTMIKKISAIADSIIAVRPGTHRALNPQTLANNALSHNIPAVWFDNVIAGVDYALTKAKPKDLILGTGSHYTVGEIINSYKST